MPPRLVREEPITDVRDAMAFYLLEPFGDEWRQTSGIRADIRNAFGGKEGGGRFNENELMPTEMSREQSAAEMEQILIANLGALGNG